MVPTFAADYYVRTDGNNANSGTTNSASGAWATVNKCASTLRAGDRCLIQPGTYRHSSAIPAPAYDGAVRSTAAGSGCSCTKGSTTVSCSSVSAVSPGDWIKCNDSDPYFNWTRVSAVNGSNLTLSEGYRGTTVTGQTLSSAQFIEFVGDGPANSIVITRLEPRPSGVTWTQNSTYLGVYQYSKSQGGTGAWSKPTGFSSQTPTRNDQWSRANDGLDSFIRVNVGGCPCSLPTSCAEAVSKVYGSWCDDGTNVYLQTWTGDAPAAVDVQASNLADDSTIWDMNRADFTAFRNIYFKGHGKYNASSTNVMVYAFTAGGNSQLLSGITAEGAICKFDPRASVSRQQFEHLKCLHKSTGGNTAGITLSGTRWYNVEFSGGPASIFGADYLKGPSSSDRIVFDRCYFHRAITLLRDTPCAGADHWYECDTKSYVDENVGDHGLWFGNSQSGYAGNIDHILVQNSIVEITADGLIIMNAPDVVFRNNTVGVSESVGGGAQANNEILGFGSTGGSEAAQFYNNLFYLDAKTANYYSGSIVSWGSYFTNVRANNNMVLAPYSTANLPRDFPYWKSLGESYPDHAWDAVPNGQESNSLFVCKQGCSSPNAAKNAKIFNDGTSIKTFVKPYVSDGTVSNYTPLAGNRAINAGLNSECPADDFYGNQRTDGACDIGAVEFQGGPSDTTPPAAVTNFSASAGDATVTLPFRHSSSSDAKGAVIRFRTDTHPSSASDGTLVCDKTGAPSADDSCQHTGAQNGTRYYYSAFSYDGARNYGAGAKADATPSMAPNSAPPPVQNNRRSDTN